KRQRKILRFFGLAFAGVLALGFAFPIWFPWVLRPLVHRQGMHYSRYERLGYNRFLLEGVSYTNRGVTLHAERIEGPLPSVLLWRHYTRGPQSGSPSLR